MSQASSDQLQSIDEIGTKIADSVVSYFADQRNLQIVESLKNRGVNLTSETSNSVLIEKVEVLKLAGCSVVISGTFAQHSREEYASIIEQLGGKKSSSISKKTSFVLAGQDMGPSKREKALSLEIPILTEEEFLKQYM